MKKFIILNIIIIFTIVIALAFINEKQDTISGQTAKDIDGEILSQDMDTTSKFSSRSVNSDNIQIVRDNDDSTDNNEFNKDNAKDNTNEDDNKITISESDEYLQKENTDSASMPKLSEDDEEMDIVYLPQEKNIIDYDGDGLLDWVKVEADGLRYVYINKGTNENPIFEEGMLIE